MDGIPRGNQVVGTGPMPALALVDVPVTDETIPPSVAWPVGGARLKLLVSHTVEPRRKTEAKTRAARCGALTRAPARRSPCSRPVAWRAEPGCDRRLVAPRRRPWTPRSWPPYAPGDLLSVVERYRRARGYRRGALETGHRIVCGSFRVFENEVAARHDEQHDQRAAEYAEAERHGHRD